MLRFQNDYSEGAHANVLRALCDTNLCSTPGYGLDDDCRRAADAIRARFACPDADVHFLVGGTQTNQLAAAAFLRPWEAMVAADTGHIFLCQVGTKKILRIYKPFIGGQPPVNGLRFLYALLPFFVRRFLYAVSNASIIGVTGSSLSGLDRYSNRMPFSLNFRSNLMKEEASRLIREASRVRIVPMP